MEKNVSDGEFPLQTCISILLTSLATLVIFLIWRSRRSSLKLPPGPPGLPIIGNLHQMKAPAFRTYDELFHQYGDIVSLRLGQLPIVLLTSGEHIKTCFAQNVFSGRMRTPFLDEAVRDSGVVFIDGDKWKFHRRLSLQILRDFGMGKSLSESTVRQEAAELCQYLDAICDTGAVVIDTGTVFSCATVNVITTVVLGERPGYNNAEYFQFMEAIHFLGNEINLFGLITELFPFLRILIPLHRFFSSSKFLQKNKVNTDFAMKRLAEHRQRMSSASEGEEPTNFVEAYYLSMKNHEKKMDKEWMEKYFNDFQITRLVVELYAAGMDTSSNTLSWMTLLLSLHDSVRERMVEEIHSLIGKEKIVSLEDKKHLPYCQAVIDETMRYSSIVPITVHRALEDAKIDKYDIPRDTMVMANMYSLNHDPNVWERPDEFHPPHFLSEDGTTYRPREHFIPFGIGKRSCIGESLARTEIFVFAVTLVQRYQFRLQLDEKNGETLEKCLEGTNGLVRSPGPHRIHISKS